MYMCQENIYIHTYDEDRTRTFHLGDVLPDFACAALAVDGHLHHHHLHTHVVPRTVSNAMTRFCVDGPRFAPLEISFYLAGDKIQHRVTQHVLLQHWP